MAQGQDGQGRQGTSINHLGINSRLVQRPLSHTRCARIRRSSCALLAQAPAGYELSKKEAAKKKAEEEEESDEEADPEVMKRLEIVKKRREDQKAARLKADGWDRMLPMTEDNHPPGMAWPPPAEAQ